MIRAPLTLRLAARDLRRRAAETLLLLAALVVAATTLTIGLVLHGQIATPYAATRAATLGPDIIATQFPGLRHPVSAAQLANLTDLAQDPDVVASSGPLPTTWSALRSGDIRAVAEVQGRDVRPADVDRPRVVDGSWVRPGSVVLERAFASALGVRAGDHVQLGGRSVAVAGIAVTAALPPYPQLCTIGCILDQPDWHEAQPGLAWVTDADARALATPREPLVYVSFLRLHDPSDAPAFAARHGSQDVPPAGPDLFPWQDVADRNAELLAHERAVVVFGGSLLVLLALATVVVLVGGRMADEVRRVGTLKAAGATPGYVARLVLVTYLAVGLVAGGAGLALGRLLAPTLVAPSAGLLGSAGGTSVSPADAGLVLGTMALLVVMASVLPARRAARTSTVAALADAGRTPRRGRFLVALSSRTASPALLVGLRLVARRPRRALLTTCSIGVAVCGSVAALYAQASLGAEAGPSGGPADPQAAQLHTVMVAVTVLLAVMAAVNLVFVTRATAADARRTLAVTRALGATPAQTAAGLGIAQLLPALAGLALGLAGGVGLFHVLSVSHPVSPTPASQAGLLIATLVAVVALTALPTRLEARRPIAVTLRQP